MTDHNDDLDRLLDLAQPAPAAPMARIEAGALAGFGEPVAQRGNWLVWGGAIAAAVCLAIAVPLMLDLRPAGMVPVDQAAAVEPLDDADAFAAALVGYSAEEAPNEADLAVEELLETL